VLNYEGPDDGHHGKGQQPQDDAARAAREDMLLMVRAADPQSLMETVNRIRSILGVYRTRTVITLANPIMGA